MSTASHFGDRLSDTIEQASALGRAAGKKLEDARRCTADTLSGSAVSVRDAGEAIDHFAERTAANLDSTAAYVRRHDVARGLDAVQQAIRRHPAGIVVGAAAAGFLLGFALRSERRPW